LAPSAQILPATPLTTSGRRKEQSHAVFPRSRSNPPPLSLVDAFGSADRLVARIHTRATMNGPMNLGATTAPPTGKVFEQDWVAVLRFEGDRIASIDEFHDNYGILIQLGLAGAP
jgi:ketosteroid isomerase-like protein